MLPVEGVRHPDRVDPLAHVRAALRGDTLDPEGLVQVQLHPLAALVLRGAPSPSALRRVQLRVPVVVLVVLLVGHHAAVLPPPLRRVQGRARALLGRARGVVGGIGGVVLLLADEHAGPHSGVVVPTLHDEADVAGNDGHREVVPDHGLRVAVALERRGAGSRHELLAVLRDHHLVARDPLLLRSVLALDDGALDLRLLAQVDLHPLARGLVAGRPRAGAVEHGSGTRPTRCLILERAAVCAGRLGRVEVLRGALRLGGALAAVGAVGGGVRGVRLRGVRGVRLLRRVRDGRLLRGSLGGLPVVDPRVLDGLEQAVERLLPLGSQDLLIGASLAGWRRVGLRGCVRGDDVLGSSQRVVVACRVVVGAGRLRGREPTPRPPQLPIGLCRCGSRLRRFHVDIGLLPPHDRRLRAALGSRLWRLLEG
mmetsp:Transcript_57709/g.129775  ORF Transcript_57709/g.129775 Transcript_57709/m.129775 type:complete len:424 (-) Transcript_57709:173-1444(-)